MYQRLRFVIIIASVAIIALAATGLQLSVSIYRANNRHISIPRDRHIVVVGNSMGETSLNDTILDEMHNLCKSAMFYIDMAEALGMTLQENPQVDTVMIAVGLPSIFAFDDNRFHTRNIQHLRSVAAHIFRDKELFFKNMENDNFIPFILTSGGDCMMSNLFGRYVGLNRHCLAHGDKNGPGISAMIKKAEDRGGTQFPYEQIVNYHKIQVEGLAQVVATCKENGVVPVLFHSPAYQIDRFIDDGGYKRMLAEIDSALMIADYSNFQFPDTCYWADVYHINYNASVMFSQHLKDNGIRYQRLSDYVNK